MSSQSVEHELLVAGFEIEASELQRQPRLVFVLVRREAAAAKGGD